MDIETSTAVKFFFPSPSLALVYFEAVANSLDAGATKIDIEISISSFRAPKSLEIKVIDNGAGFTDDNFQRFSSLMRPRDSMHKGLGRLVYLNYFSRVKVDSCWGSGSRSFIFDSAFKGVATEAAPSEPGRISTTLHFVGFTNDRVKSYDDLKPAALKERIIEHFFPRLNEIKEAGGDFTISIDLETSSENSNKEFFPSKETITPDDLPVMTWSEVSEHGLDSLSSIKFGFHIKRTSAKGSILTAVCVDGRTIPMDLIKSSAVPVGYAVKVLISSEFLASSGDSSRQNVIIPEDISEARLFSVLRKEIGAFLSKEIPQIKEDNRKTKERFEEKFPHLLGYFEEETVGLIDRDDSLNSAQAKFFRAQKEILQCETLNERMYEKSLELSSRALTEYVLYREKIIQRMREVSFENLEAEIHNLICPRYEVFEGEDLLDHVYRNNAWLLDDKFMSFQTILSESRMDSVIEAITDSESPIQDDGRPDIAMIFSGDPDSSTSVDVVVVEIKKKTKEEKDNQYAVNQLLTRARRLTAHCPNIGRVWYYALVSIDSEFEDSLLQQDFVPVFSSGKVYYREFSTRGPKGTVPTPVYVLSYDAVVSDAGTRNHTFLEILRSGMRRFSKGD